jgi:hypothetical protein
MMCLLKAALCYVCYRQGRMTLALFKPILKDYSDAEAGRIQGIAMVRRLSKDMAALIKGLWKMLGTCHAVIGVCAVFTVMWANEQADQYLEIKHDFYATQEADQVQVESDPIYDFVPQLPEDDEFVFTDQEELKYGPDSAKDGMYDWFKDIMKDEYNSPSYTEHSRKWMKDSFPETQALIDTTMNSA